MAMGEPPSSSSPLLLPDGKGAVKGKGKGEKGDLFGFPDADANGKGIQNACVAGVNQCDAALGGPGAAANWSFVGGGKGGYEMVETLVFVGEGKGNYHKDEPPPVARSGGKVTISWQRRLFMGTLVSFLLVGGIALVASLILGPKRQAGAAPPIVAKQVRQAPDPAHDGVLGGRSPVLPQTQPQQKAVHYGCNEQALAHWSIDERRWCCSKKGKGCPNMECQSGRDNWQHAWSDGKKIWCCRHHGVGCPVGQAPPPTPPALVAMKPLVPPQPAPAPPPPPPPAVHDERPPPPPAPMVPALPPAPAAPAERPPPPPAPVAQAQHKQAKATPQPTQQPTPHATPHATPQATPTQKPDDVVSFGGPAIPAATPATQAQHGGTKFDCSGWKGKAQSGWTSEKEDWCCWHYGTGCPDS